MQVNRKKLVLRDSDPESTDSVKKKPHSGKGRVLSRTNKIQRKNAGDNILQDEPNEKKHVRDDLSDTQWSKSKKKRMRTLKAKRSKADSSESSNNKKDMPDIDTNSKDSTPVSRTSKALPEINSVHVHKEAGHKSSLQKSFQERLSGSRFRILNEELYTTTSQAAFQRFSQQPKLFDEYHIGFRHQVEQWPVNPVTILVDKIRQEIEKTRNKEFVVADFGCGDAQLAKQLLNVSSSPLFLTTKTKNIKQHPKLTVHSFDLVARGPNAKLITACDVAHTPLPNKSVDVGVFCLSLMGTNLADFVREAHRVLLTDGRLHIAEVRSRFESKSPKINKDRNAGVCDDDDNEQGQLQKFLESLKQLGFDCISTDRSNKMFFLLEMKKNDIVPDRDLTFTAKPCIYKRR